MQKGFVTVALGLIFSAFASRPALALGDELVQAHIPFAFHIAKTTLPPGDYLIRTSEDMDRDLLEIRKDDGRVNVFFLTLTTESSTKVAKPELVFDQLGQERFLRSILIPGGSGNQLTVSAEETQAALAAARAASKTAPTVSGD
jgi:hypothetical protein